MWKSAEKRNQKTADLLSRVIFTSAATSDQAGCGSMSSSAPSIALTDYAAGQREASSTGRLQARLIG